METCFGLLSSEHSEDAVRVGLVVDADVLRATGADGSSWDIPLDRVHLTSWSAEQLRFDLAGEAVSFLPDDPDVAIGSLVPAVLARHEMPAAATTRTPAAPAAPPREPSLTVDLADPTPPAQPVPTTRSRPTAPSRSAPPPRRWLRRLGALLVLALIALGGWAMAQRGSSPDPAAAAREALAANGFPAISVSINDGLATLTGSVATPDEVEVVGGLVAALDGIDEVANQLVVVTTAVDGDLGPEAARAALSQAGITGVTVRIEGGVAALSGTVASESERRSAQAALLAVPQIDLVDNQLAIASRPDDVIEIAARAALDAGGFGAFRVSVTDGIATLAGVVPQDVLGDGVFAFSDRVEAAVLEVDGVSGLINRLQLTGDEATLRRQLRDLTDGSPIVFALGRSELSAASQTALESAGAIIQAQPGLRVLIAGHTDTTGSAAFNEVLSRERAASVRAYLVEQGIAANRLLVVAYGELFPSAAGAQPADRRVVFEVAG